MEAHWLFDVDMDQVQVVIQPASVIHSMIEYEDGAVIAQRHTGYEAAHSVRSLLSGAPFPSGDRLDFTKLKEITFDEPDMETFRGLKLAYEAGKPEAPCLPCLTRPMNWRFHCFWRKIPYLAITDLIQGAMENHKRKAAPNVDQILAAEQEAYDFIRETLRKERI